MTMYYPEDTWFSEAKPRKVSRGGGGGRVFQRTNRSPLVFQTNGLFSSVQLLSRVRLFATP